MEILKSLCIQLLTKSHCFRSEIFTPKLRRNLGTWDEKWSISLVGHLINHACCASNTELIVFNYTYAANIVPGYAVHNGDALVKAQIFWHRPASIYDMHPIDAKVVGDFYVISSNAYNRNGGEEYQPWFTKILTNGTIQFSACLNIDIEQGQIVIGMSTSSRLLCLIPSSCSVKTINWLSLFLKTQMQAASKVVAGTLVNLN